MNARFRLLLAILALVFAPIMAAPLAVPALAAEIGAEAGACSHPCDGDAVPHHDDGATCSVACGLSAALAPLLLPVAAQAEPGSAMQRQPAFQSLVLSATPWPPPVRPPRA